MCGRDDRPPNGGTTKPVNLSSSSRRDGSRPHALAADGVLKARHLALAVSANADLDDDMSRPGRDERRDVCGGQPREHVKSRPSLGVVMTSARARP